MKFLQHLLGWRMASLDDSLQRLKVTGLVMAELIEAAATA